MTTEKVVKNIEVVLETPPEYIKRQQIDAMADLFREYLLPTRTQTAVASDEAR